MPQRFIPDACQQASFGAGHILTIYKPITNGMSPAEAAHSMHMLRATIINATNVPIEARLQGLGTYSNQSTIVSQIMQDFLRHFHDNVFELSSPNHELLAFLDSSGAVINNAGTAANPLILKPVQNGVIADCRPADLSFVRFKITCSFVPCIEPSIVTNSPSEQISIESILALPQTTVIVNDGNNNPRQLTTFHGPANLRLPMPDVVNQILRHTLQTGPAILGPPAHHNGTTCTLLYEPIASTIGNSILELALPTAIAAAYEAVCPGHVANPQSAIAEIKQTYVTDDNNKVTIPVQEYFNNYTAAAAPLLQGIDTGIDIFTPFIDGLNDDLQRVVEQRNPYRGQVVPRNTRVVLRRLRQILAIASNAQEEITNTSKLISSVVSGVGPNFTSIPVPNQATTSVASQAAVPALPEPSQVIPPPPQCPLVPAHPSQAEKTLQQYQRRTNFCWGCSILFPNIPNHYWYDNRKKKIVCPNQHLPEAQAEAARRRSQHNARMTQEQTADDEPPRQRARTEPQAAQSELIQALLLQLQSQNASHQNSSQLKGDKPHIF